MNNYLKKLPFNYFHYYAIAVLILLLGISNYLFFMLYIPFFYLIRNYKNKYLVLIVVLVFLLYVSTYEKVFKIAPKGNTFIVTEKNKRRDYYTYYIRENFNKYLFYSNEELNVGDVVKLNYNYEEFTKNRTPNGFNLKKHYASKRIFYKLNVKDVEVVGHKFHINKIKDKLISGLDKYPTYVSMYLKMFLFSTDTFEEEVKEAKVSLGIIHLFALSGMHINFIILVLSFISKKLKININKKSVFIIFVIYLWFSGFSVSLLRAVLMYILFNSYKEKGLTRLDSLSISFILILIINPFYRFRVGFILSFLVSFLLIITPYKNTLKERFIVHLKIIFLSVLIASNINGKIYPLSLLTSFMFTSIFPIIILPLIFISVVPFLSIITEPLLNGFTNLILAFETNFSFKVPYQSLISIFVYVLIFIYAIYGEDNKIFFKRSIFLVIFILFVYVSPRLDFNSKIYFLDVGQGDATFIQNKFNDGNVLIDANKGTKSFLDTLGDINIDYFFITHGDLDHAYEAKEIIESFNVKNIIVSPYDESEIISSLKGYSLKKSVVGDVYKINDLEIRVLGPLRKYNSLNNNSLVLQIKMFGEIYLFTGDIEEEAISDLINKYRYELKCDLLHVSHHGAYGGTPKELLEYTRAKEAIISVGKYNYYNHPHKETILNLRLYNVKIYLTSNEQTIIKRKYHFLIVKKGMI